MTECATCARISSLVAVREPPLLAQCVNRDERLYYATVQNLVYGCGNVPQTTANSSDTPLIHWVQHVQQSFDMSMQLPADLHNATLFKMAGVFNRSTYSSKGHGCALEWMLQTLSTSEITTVTVCRVKKESAIWSAMTVSITNTTTLHYAHMIARCQWTQFLMVLHFFSQCIIVNTLSIFWYVGPTWNCFKNINSIIIQ